MVITIDVFFNRCMTPQLVRRYKRFVRWECRNGQICIWGHGKIDLDIIQHITSSLQMEFYHTLFVRQSVDTPYKINELTKYMYLTVDTETPHVPAEGMTPTASDAPLAQTYGSLPLDASLERVAVKQPPAPRVISCQKREPTYTLFWAIYIAMNGYEEYAQIGRGYSNWEMNEKQKIVATIQKSPTILKQTNQKMTKDKIKEIMSEVMSGKNMELSTLPAFATVYNKRIIVVIQNKMRIDVSAEGAEDAIVIRKDSKGMFAPDLDANVGIIERETFCFHQIDKPLRAVSTYKLDELATIAALLDVPTQGKKKPELYVELVQRCI